MCGRNVSARVLPVNARCLIDVQPTREPRAAQEVAPLAIGPGGALKSLLRSILGITATAECSCNARAAQMDARGCEWCEANIDTIVGWLREEAEKRGLPFLDVVGRLLVRRAIRNARRAASNAGNTVS
jgi:hypothetical protein